MDLREENSFTLTTDCRNKLHGLDIFWKTAGKYLFYLSGHHTQYVMKHTTKNWGSLLTFYYFQVTPSTVVCSDHFKPTDFKWTAVYKTLKPGSVPSIFNWQEQDKFQRKSPKKRMVASTSEMEIDEVSGEENTSSDSDLAPETEAMFKIENLEKIIAEKNEEIEKLKLERFGVNRFSYDDDKINFYTGFPTYQSFVEFYSFAEPTASNMQSAYYQPSETLSLKGRPRTMLLIDELFMVLSRIRLNLLEEDLSVRCNVSVSTVSRKIITWVNFLYFILGQIPIWLERDVIQRLMPQCFKDDYPSTRVVIDCTEIFTQSPTSLVLSSQLYSNYKSHTTFKALIGIAPHGAITFISPLYTGNMSDVEITRTSGLLNLLQPGDSIMADKGFVLKKDLEKRQVGLNIPPFLRQNAQFDSSEIQETETIARLRIHVERIMKRIKENRIFATNMPLSLVGSVNQIWAVACMLANFDKPIVSGWGI